VEVVEEGDGTPLAVGEVPPKLDRAIIDVVRKSQLTWLSFVLKVMVFVAAFILVGALLHNGL